MVCSCIGLLGLVSIILIALYTINISVSAVTATTKNTSTTTTEVLSSTPVFTVEYLFPGETINVVKDANSADTLTRVAISSHGMNIAVET